MKELEQLLQSMEVYKRRKQEQESQSSPPFSQFFIFPQYSTGTTHHCNKLSATDQNESMAHNNDHQNCAAVADIEVNMVESHANLKILSKKVHPRQLWKMVSGFQILRLTVLHLNVTSTADQMVLYSFSVKVSAQFNGKETNKYFNILFSFIFWKFYSSNIKGKEFSEKDVLNYIVKWGSG